MANETINGITLRFTAQGAMVGLDGATVRVDYTYEQVFGDGTGNNQIGAIFQDLARALNNTSETLDLDGLTNAFGGSMSDNNNMKFGIWRLRDTTTAARLTVGGGDFASAAGPLVDASDKAATGPDGIIIIISPRDGMPITASTADGLLIATNTNTSYDVIMGFDNT